MFSNSFFSGETDATTRLGVVAVMVVVLLCGWKLLHPSATFAADGADPDWDQAVTESHESNKPVIVIFTASWCPACQLLQSEDLSRDDVRDELDEHYVLFRVDLTRPSPAAAAHARALGVSAIPTLVRFDRFGHENDRAHYLRPEQMLHWLHEGE